MKYLIPARAHWLLTLCTLCATTAIGAAQQLDAIAVVVNEDVITLQEYEHAVADFSQQLKISAVNSPDYDALKKQVLERMIKNTIQLQQATRLGIVVDDITLNRMLVTLAESNQLSLDQLRSRIEAEGMSFTRFREQTRDELIIKQLQQRVVASRVNVTDQEIRQYVESSQLSENNSRYHINHILIATPQTASPDDIGNAKQKAEKLYQQLVDGADFGKLAIKQSDGRDALQGGDLGWREASELPEAFVTQLRNMNDGAISPPIRSASGFHIIKLIANTHSQQKMTQTHARHILLRTTPELGDEAARIKLLEIKQQINRGENFAVLAKQYSEDPGSKDNGGDLGWANPGAFVDAFEDVMSQLDIGETSEPFQSQFGWHVMQVLERREQDQTDDTLKAQARQQIRKRKIDEELRLWLRRIRDEAFVEIIAPSLKPLLKQET